MRHISVTFLEQKISPLRKRGGQGLPFKALAKKGRFCFINPPSAYAKSYGRQVIPL